MPRYLRCIMYDVNLHSTPEIDFKIVELYVYGLSG